MLIKNALIISPENKLNQKADILIANGKIIKIAPDIHSEGEKILDASGLIAMPGIIDMHTHLRDPGFEYKEDVLSGCDAAAAGGVTAVAAMPNTSPVTDSEQVIKYIIEKAKNAKARVYPIATITKGMSGSEITDIKSLKKAGAVGISDDGRPVPNARVMSDALAIAYKEDMPVISHCEDLDIIGNGIINKGEISKKLGVCGMDRSSEDSITAREIVLAECNNSYIHIAHVSTKGAVNLIREAKARGVRVTCETCPHYFTLTDELLLKKDADYRMNPPLREEKDRLAVIEGIKDGTIDCIVTDHAPHASYEKEDFETAPNGVIGLETSLAVTYDKLVATGVISLEKMIELMSVNPARILKVKGGVIAEGEVADITIFDKQYEWRVDLDKLHSKSKNSVFKGMSFKGKAVATICCGEIVYNIL